MKKIPTIFQRSDDRRHVINEVTPGCEWVFTGQAQATRKWDGTCVRITHEWYDGPGVSVEVRREVKPGKKAPAHFTPDATDEVTGKTFGWEPYGMSGFAKYIDEAMGVDYIAKVFPDVHDWPEGTYELCGPKINGNPEGLDKHVLLRHGAAEIHGEPLTFSGLRDFLTRIPDMEGIVWHHPDGRMAKLKRRDFKPSSSSPSPDAVADVEQTGGEA